jgi:hypothetical protein
LSVRRRDPPSTDRKSHLASARLGRDDQLIEDVVITRDEVVALLFNVSDIAASLTRIEAQDDGEEDDEG